LDKSDAWMTPESAGAEAVGEAAGVFALSFAEFPPLSDEQADRNNEPAISSADSEAMLFFMISSRFSLLSPDISDEISMLYAGSFIIETDIGSVNREPKNISFERELFVPQHEKDSFRPAGQEEPAGESFRSGLPDIRHQLALHLLQRFRSQAVLGQRFAFEMRVNQARHAELGEMVMRDSLG